MKDRHTKIERFGTDALGVRIRGDRSRPESSTFLVKFPGGEIELSRTSDDSYWVHVSVDRPGSLADARLDIKGKHAADCDPGDFNDPGLFHLAVRIR